MPVAFECRRGRCGAISAAKAAVSAEQELAQNPKVVSDTLYSSRHFQPALLARKSRGGPFGARTVFTSLPRSPLADFFGDPPYRRTRPVWYWAPRASTHRSLASSF